MFEVLRWFKELEVGNFGIYYVVVVGEALGVLPRGGEPSFSQVQ